MSNVRYRNCINCGEASEITTRISRCSNCWDSPLAEEILPDGTLIRAYKNCRTVTPSEPLGATAYKSHPKHYRELSEKMAFTLRQAAAEAQIFTRDKVDHILSLDFLAAILTSKGQFSEEVLKNANRQLMSGLFSWHRSIKAGIITDFERRSYAALMRLHRPGFLKLMSQA